MSKNIYIFLFSISSIIVLIFLTVKFWQSSEVIQNEILIDPVYNDMPYKNNEKYSENFVVDEKNKSDILSDIEIQENIIDVKKKLRNYINNSTDPQNITDGAVLGIFLMIINWSLENKRIDIAIREADSMCSELKTQNLSIMLITLSCLYMHNKQFAEGLNTLDKIDFENPSALKPSFRYIFYLIQLIGNIGYLSYDNANTIFIELKKITNELENKTDFIEVVEKMNLFFSAPYGLYKMSFSIEMAHDENHQCLDKNEDMLQFHCFLPLSIIFNIDYDFAKKNNINVDNYQKEIKLEVNSQ